MLDVSPDRGTRNGRWCERKRAPKVDASGDSVDGIELLFLPGYGFTIACTGEKKFPMAEPSMQSISSAGSVHFCAEGETGGHATHTARAP